MCVLRKLVKVFDLEELFDLEEFFEEYFVQSFKKFKEINSLRKPEV